MVLFLGVLTDPVSYAIQVEKRLRLDALFEVSDPGKKMTLKPQPIYFDLMEVQQKNPLFEFYRNKVQCTLGWLARDKPGETSLNDSDANALEDDINGMYYAAKTRVYLERSYFDELQELQYRSDFARSLTLTCALIASLYLILAILIYMPREIRFNAQQMELFRKRIGFRVLRWWLTSEGRAKLRLVLVVSVLYLIGAWCAHAAYVTEMKNYNLRVFGYYISIVSRENSGDHQDPSGRIRLPQ
ncbi:MAG TPA: hypothetical protein VK582_13960 [Pyrinomonadaceae bacterium]|nr:hypothetical protein [Pyrinomonadaceae bacterium]